MRPSWVAATVRARLIASHGVGRERALEIGRSASLEAAIAALAGSAYGESLEARSGLGEAQSAVAATALWQLRVLAGWLPPGAAAHARVLSGWFEIANIDQRLAELAGAPSRPPLSLGSLASASARIATASSAADVRAALTASEWGDPGDDTPATIARAIRFAWARRAIDALPQVETWALAAVALVLARDIAGGRRAVVPAAVRIPELGAGFAEADDIPTLARRIAPRASWALDNVHDGNDLWIGEARWWRRVEDDARGLVLRGEGGLPVLIGAAALIAVDARRVVMALTAAARGGDATALEMLDAAA